MDREYFNNYFHYERNHWWFKVRAQILRNRISSITSGKKNISILNIGAATGLTTELLSQFGNVTSVEFDKDCCEFLSKTFRWKVVNASITELPFDTESFDLVCAFDVVEHVDDDQKGVNEMIRVCKTTGNIILTVPAFMSLWSTHDEVNHHKRRYLRRQLENLFPTDSGKINYSSYFNSLLFIPIFLVRKFMNLLPSGTPKRNEKSDFALVNNKFLNAVFYLLFSLEIIWLKFMKFPFGVSILLVFKKNFPGHANASK